MKNILFTLLLCSSSISVAFWGNDAKLSNSNGSADTHKKVTYELAVCSVDTKIKKNLTYYHLASVNTKLLCEISSNTRVGTFEAFYNDGWRLIQIVSIDSRLATKDKTVPYSLIYLERIKL